MKVFCKEFITVWTRELVSWLSRKFDSISIDLTPVEEKLDDVKSDVGDVKTAVENIDFSTLAKQGSNAAATNTAILAAMPTIPTDYAKQGTNPDATNTAILAAFGNIDFSALAKQGTNANATLTAVLEALTGGDDPSPDIPEGVAERLAMILQFFGLPESLPGSYTALTQAEVIASTRAEQVNAWGEDGCPIPDYLPEGITEQMVEAAATALGITYYEPNFNIASL